MCQRRSEFLKNPNSKTLATSTSNQIFTTPSTRASAHLTQEDSQAADNVSPSAVVPEEYLAHHLEKECVADSSIQAAAESTSTQAEVVGTNLA